ncbi:MAG TPA: ABC transporter, partial [Aciduliprofundum sp.]|nr:ABC transporter [Aciduliprofundum sp.]
LLFLSGAFFPIDGLPGWMKVLSLVNPMTYGVDLARWSLVGVSSFGPGLDLAVLGAVAALSLFIAAFCYERATLE